MLSAEGFSAPSRDLQTNVYKCSAPWIYIYISISIYIYISQLNKSKSLGIVIFHLWNLWYSTLFRSARVTEFTSRICMSDLTDIDVQHVQHDKQKTAPKQHQNNLVIKHGYWKINYFLAVEWSLMGKSSTHGRSPLQDTRNLSILKTSLIFFSSKTI